jgi:hypothetical protein
MIKVNAASCILCGQDYQVPSTTPRSYQGLCSLCFSQDALREWDRLESFRSHLAPGTPDTLTLQEWLQIITRYRSKCALCLVVHFSRIAIWIPAAGLSVGNTVPLCTACSFHKDHSWRDAIQRLDAQLREEEV